MNINNIILERRIKDYATLIKNPRTWKSFKNFVLIQNDIKSMQMNLMSAKIKLINVPNYEHKFCFCEYIIFEFPELTEKIRRMPHLQDNISSICDSIPLELSPDNFGNEGHTLSIQSQLAELFGNQVLTKNEPKTLATAEKTSITSTASTPQKELFIQFLAKFHTDVPRSAGEWRLFFTNNIITASNMSLIENVYSTQDSNMIKTYTLFNNSWDHFFQSLEEYVNYIISNKMYAYVFIQMFVESTHQFKEDKTLLNEFQLRILELISRLVQNDTFLIPFTDPLIERMYMATDLSHFARYEDKLLAMNGFSINNNQHFDNMCNYIIRRNIHIMQSQMLDSRYFGLLVNTCRYNNTLLKIFYIPDAIDSYLNERRIFKASWNIGAVAAFKDENQNNLLTFAALLVGLKYDLSILRENIEEYSYKDQRDKLNAEKTLIRLRPYDLFNVTNTNYVYMDKFDIGDIISRAFQVMSTQSQRYYLNPLRESLETSALMIFHKELQSLPNNADTSLKYKLCVRTLPLPRIIIQLIVAKNPLISNFDFSQKTRDLVFIDRIHDTNIKELIKIRLEEVPPKKIERPINLDVRNTILIACRYLFKEFTDNKNLKECLIGTGKEGGMSTNIYLEILSSNPNIKKIITKYTNIINENNGKIQTIIILAEIEKAPALVAKLKELKKAGNEIIVGLKKTDFE